MTASNTRLVDRDDLLTALATAQANPDLSPEEILETLPMGSTDPPKPRRQRKPPSKSTAQGWLAWTLIVWTLAFVTLWIWIAVEVQGTASRGDAGVGLVILGGLCLIGVPCAIVAVTMVIWRWRAGG